MTNWPLCSLKCQNAITIQHFNENKLICNFRGHIGLKQPRNFKLDFMCAQADSTTRQKKENKVSQDNFSQFSKLSSESQENFCSIIVLHVCETSVMIQISYCNNIFSPQTAQRPFFHGPDFITKQGILHIGLQPQQKLEVNEIVL